MWLTEREKIVKELDSKMLFVTVLYEFLGSFWLRHIGCGRAISAAIGYALKSCGQFVIYFRFETHIVLSRLRNVVCPCSGRFPARSFFSYWKL